MVRSRFFIFERYGRDFTSLCNRFHETTEDVIETMSNEAIDLLVFTAQTAAMRRLPVEGQARSISLHLCMLGKEKEVSELNYMTL